MAPLTAISSAVTPRGPVSSAIWMTCGFQAWEIHWPQGNSCGTRSSLLTIPSGASRVMGTRRRRDPRKGGETLHYVDQPVESAAGLDDTGPPAQEQCLLERGRPIHREQHGNRGNPGQEGQIERRHRQEPQAPAQGDEAEQAGESELKHA